MLSKQQVLEIALNNKLADAKVGIIVQDITDIDPYKALTFLSENTKKEIFASVVNCDIPAEAVPEGIQVSSRIEDSIKWRSMPECAGSIVTFIMGESNKKHSLNDFDVLSTRNLSETLIEYCIKAQTNAPTIQYWTILKDHISDFTFDMLMDFANSTELDKDNPLAIPENMWRLGLLRDDKILGTKVNVAEAFDKNRYRIIEIGQMSEQSRKRLSASLAKAKGEKKAELKLTYKRLLEYFKYGKKETLRDLSMEAVNQLWSATKIDVKPTPPVVPIDPENPEQPPINPPIDPVKKNTVRKKDFDNSITEALLSDDEEDQKFVREIEEALSSYFDDEQNTDKDPADKMDQQDLQGRISVGRFEGKTVDLGTPNTGLRRFVGNVCNADSWGGLMKSDVPILKEALLSQEREFHSFNPTVDDSILSSAGIGTFEYLRRFDEQIENEKFEQTIKFGPIIDKLTDGRLKLLKRMDMIMYHPELLFGANNEARKELFGYIDSWAELLKAYCNNESVMHNISSQGSNFVARSLLALDTVYVRTPKEWKGVLLPLHPLYLWKYNCVFKDLRDTKDNMSKEDLDKLAKVLNNLPQLVNFLVVDKAITQEADVALPYAGQIDMLPRFENKTNRYMGNDGVDFLEELLSRWINYAPYTQREIRVAVADVPDLVEVVRILGDFISQYNCKIDLAAFFTHGQNGMFHLAQLDYDEKDHDISDYIKEGSLQISLHNANNAKEVREYLMEHPVHILYMFDQSSFNIEYGPSNQNLYITPLVVTYDYEYDDITKQGAIFPSSDVDSGMVGDYYRVMRYADIIQQSSVPRPTFNPSADLSDVNKMISCGATAWLAVADRLTSTYVPEDEGALTIGEKHAEHRNISIWASSDSRIIKQYMTLLREFNLYPSEKVLVDLFEQFGHITSEGLISIPRIGNNPQQIQNRKKGLIGTVFAAAWYVKKYPNALVASLDSQEARLWLKNNDVSNDRADLIGLRYDESSNTLFIDPIEVKTRDESSGAHLEKNPDTGELSLDGHPIDQIIAMQRILKEIFVMDEATTFDMFNSARREVLKYQIVSECFRKIHDTDWQKKWSQVLKKAFDVEHKEAINIVIEGKLLHIKLSDSGEGVDVVVPSKEGNINYVVLSSSLIQKQILEIEKPIIPKWTAIDFDDSGEKNDEIEIDKNPVEEYIVEVDTSSVMKVAEESVTYTVSTKPSEETNEKKTDEVCEKAEDSEEIQEEIQEEIKQLIKDFVRACPLRRIDIEPPDIDKVVVGPGLIRVRFKLKRGQALDNLRNQLEDIGREMKRSGLLVQQLKNSDELVLDIPRLKRDPVLFSDVVDKLPKDTSIEEMWVPVGRTPEGEDVIVNLAEMPHLLVGGSTGSGKTVLLFTLLAAILKQHKGSDDIKLVLSSAGIEDFIHFEGLPQLIGGKVLTSAEETVDAIMNVVNKEFEERARIIAEARVSNIIEYNKKCDEKLAPILVVIDEFADISDQLKKQEKDAFFTTIRRIVQIGRKRGVHLILCTQRPSANLVPTDIKAQLNGRIALRVNDNQSSRMILEETGAQELQKYGDMYLRYNNEKTRAQGYFISVEELDEIVEEVIAANK